MKQKDILLFIVPTLIIVIAWIIFNLYHTSTTTENDQTTTSTVIAISPNFDTKVIDELKKRENVVAATEISVSNVVLPISSTSATLTPVATPTAPPSASSSATATTSAR